MIVQTSRLRRLHPPGLQLRLDAQDTAVEARRDALMSYVEHFLAQRRRLWPDIRRPIVYDIDDTLVTRPDGIHDVLIPRIARTYHMFRTHFPTYIVTARVADRGITARMLKQARLDGYVKLLMRPPGMDPAHFKWEARQRISQEAGPVQLTVGDQHWDVLPHPSRMRLPSCGCILLHPRGKGELGVLLPEHGG